MDNRLRSTYRFVPSLITLGAMGLALLLVKIDRLAGNGATRLALASGGGADTIVALTVSSQHFSPR